ncbi:MAG: hypothetical protein RAP03_04725 [Candidatus Electryonea clarkiae]|nr:hypothetical protein [Candidatus Electryonea clarkiae]
MEREFDLRGNVYDNYEDWYAACMDYLLHEEERECYEREWMK